MSYSYPPSNLCPESQMCSQQSWCWVRTSVPAPLIFPVGKTHRTQALPLCAHALVLLQCAEWAPSIWALAKSSLQVLMGTDRGSSYWRICFHSFCYKTRLTEQSQKEMEMWWYRGTLPFSLSWHSTNYTCNTRTQLIQEEKCLSKLLLFSASV